MRIDIRRDESTSARTNSIPTTARTAVVTIAAVVASIGTIGLNVAHGLMVGGIAAAVVFGMIDTFKVLVISMRRWALAFFPLALAGICLAAISTLAITDFFAERLGANTAEHAGASARDSELKAERNLVQGELNSLGEKRKIRGWLIHTSGQIEAEISAKKRDPLWATSSGCTSTTPGPQQRKLCVEIDRLMGALQGAKESEALEAEEATARRRLANLKDETPIEATDRMTRLIQKLAAIDKHPTHLLALALALIVETLTIFFPINALGSPKIAAAASTSTGVAAEPAPAAVAADPKPLKPVPPRRFNAKPKSVVKPTKVAAASVNVVPLRRQPLALVSNVSAATPLPNDGGKPVASRQGKRGALGGGGNPAMATPLPSNAAPPGTPQQMQALATVGNPPGNPLADSAGNPVSSRQDAEADLVELLSSGNAVPSQSKLAERWGVNPGTASKWIARLEADGVIAVALHNDGSKCIQLPS